MLTLIAETAEPARGMRTFKAKPERLVSEMMKLRGFRSAVKLRTDGDVLLASGAGDRILG